MGKTYRREKDFADGYSNKNKKTFKKISKKLRKQRQNNHNFESYGDEDENGGHSMYYR
jgi:hypothetical protein